MLKVLLICLCALHVSAQSVDLPEELIARKGLPNFLRKLQHSHDTITIAYLGGSITAANNGWRDKTYSWLEKQYPDVVFKQINATIGGTGSRLGVHRLDDHVLKYKPDLLFVEFAVNDHDAGRKSVLTSMEAIVRKTWKAYPETDICFVYTFAYYLLKDYNNGVLPSSVKAMEDIAGYYGIPSINLSPKIVKLINTKKLFLNGKQPFQNDSTFFSADIGVHPFAETGHTYYAESIINSIKKLDNIGKVARHLLGPVYYSSKLEKATMVNITSNMITGNFEDISTHDNKQEDLQRFSRYVSDIFKVYDNATLSFSFSGQSIGFFDIQGPSSCQLKILIDNDLPRYIGRFDKYSSNNRLSYFFIDGLENKKHNISVQLSDMKIDKFSILKKSPSEVEAPNRFNEYCWMVASILSDGEIY